MIELIRDLLYPAHCTACTRPVAYTQALCTTCESTIQPVVALYLPLGTTRELPIFAVGAYQQPLDRLILQKFGGRTRASMLLGHLILQHTPIASRQYDLIVPVPLHWTRYAYRGFNQATEIARVLSREFNIPLAYPVHRTIRTQFQARLDAQARQQNVAQAFARNHSTWFGYNQSLRNKRILLVDDLCTTGATLHRVASILLPEKPAHIEAVVACRAV